MAGFPAAVDTGRFGEIPEDRLEEFEKKIAEGAERAKQMRLVLALFLTGPAAPHGIVLEEGSPPCYTLRATDGFTVDFWIDDTDRFLASVTREMIVEAELLTGTERTDLITRLSRRAAA